MTIEIDKDYRNILDFLKIYIEKTEQIYIDEGWTVLSDSEVINYLLNSIEYKLKALNVIYKCPKCEETDINQFEEAFEEEWTKKLEIYCSEHPETEMEIIGFEKVERFTKSEDLE